MQITALSLSVEIVATFLVFFLTVSVSNKAFLKKKSAFTNVTWIAVLGTLVHTLFFPLSNGLIASTILLITSFVLVNHFFDCSFKKAATLATISVAAVVVETVLLSMFGLTVSTRWI